jgi:hypothetical protein
MPPDDTVPPADDWEFPPVDPADDLIGWRPEPAMPEPTTPEAAVPEPPAAEAAAPEAAAPEEDDADGPVEQPAAATPRPVIRPTAPMLLPGSASPPPVLPVDPPVVAAVEPPVDPPVEPPVEPRADPFAGVGEPLLAAEAQEEPPSTGVLPVPRRTSLAGGPVSPVRALAGAAVAVAGVLLGIGALLWATDAPDGNPTLQQPQAQSSETSPSASPLPSPTPVATVTAAAPVVSPVVPSPTVAAAPKLALTVLNNSNINGLAHRAAAKYRAMGWPIKLEGSFRGRIPVTTVYYAPGQQASAELLQKEFPAIQRVRPRFTGLPGSGLTVVLTRDYPA